MKMMGSEDLSDDENMREMGKNREEVVHSFNISLIFLSFLLPLFTTPFFPFISLYSSLLLLSHI